MPDSSQLVLAIDTCGAAGSVALGRVAGGELEVLGESALEGRTYAATLVPAVRALLAEHRIGLPDLACLVVVSGPGSFTGVRIGLSVVKGLAEGAGLPVLAVSRLEVLAHQSGCANAALDAHRHEVFLRVGTGDKGRELLAGAGELATIDPPDEIAACDAAALELLTRAWPMTRIAQAEPPTAADALRLAVPRVNGAGDGEFADVAPLDGHYLRRSDAEIFGETATASA